MEEVPLATAEMQRFGRSARRLWNLEAIDSLKAARIAGRVWQRIDRKIPRAGIDASATVAQLALLILAPHGSALVTAALAKP